jgi:phytoene desaturase
MKAIVVGAGIAGLASALRLASAGFEVEVFESNAYPGGKISEKRLGEYRFDTGPSLFTMPHLVDELFYNASKNPEDYGFGYEKLETVCNYFWEDGTKLSAYSDLKKYEKEISTKLNASPKELRNYFKKAKFRYDTTASIFLEASLHKFSTYLRWKTFIGVLRLPFLGLYNSLDTENRRSFSEPKLVQLFNRYATYNGSNPYKTPGIMSLIPHLEQGFGAFFPKGGMQQITQSVYKLALDLGVKFHFNTKVDEIIVEKGKAIGVKAAQLFYRADSIVCNMDVFFAYDKLLPKEKRPEKILGQPKSSSALIFYWGISDEFPELDVHNIFFSEDYKAEFEAIFDNGNTIDDPTVYIHISSKVAPDDAPLGQEAWFVMINVPANKGQDWDEIISRSKKNILTKLSRILNRDIENLIKAEAVLEPRTIESITQSHLGSLYGSSSNNRMAAFFRHANFSDRIKNLYFVGGSVHPGGGIPLCLLSAKIATDIIKKEKIK